jgi:uncharacterized protein YyaL (SSP411 family)
MPVRREGLAKRLAFFSRFAASDTAQRLRKRGETENAISDGAVEAAMDWLRTAHETTGRKGVAAGFSLRHGWQLPFPETTGYILQTLLRYGRRTQTAEDVQRAYELGDWEIEVQNADGGVIHGDYTGEAKPSSVFNTGMVIHGWLDLHHDGHDARYLEAAVRAGRFLADNQDADGIWRGEIEYHDIPHTYNARAAWALLRLAQATEVEDFEKAALRQLEWVLSVQRANGWFDHCIFRPGALPNTHGIAYTLRGLLESHVITERDDFLAAVLKPAKALLAEFDVRGRLAANFDAGWQPAAWHECLTGTAQLGGIWLRLHEITGEEHFLDGGLRAIAQAASRQIRIDWAPARGALPGSFPIYGRYAPFRLPSWATKFLVDGLLHQADHVSAKAI